MCGACIVIFARSPSMPAAARAHPCMPHHTKRTGMRTVVVPVSHSTAQFSFHFDALSRDPSSHMDLYNAVAVCQGCSDVTCKRKKLPAFIAGTRDTETKYKIEVHEATTPGGERGYSVHEAARPTVAERVVAHTQRIAAVKASIQVVKAQRKQE